MLLVFLFIKIKPQPTKNYFHECLFRNENKHKFGVIIF